jgi:hypothetical protein
MPTRPEPLSIPEIRAFLAVRSGLTVRTAAEEAGLTPVQVRDALDRVGLRPRISPRGRTH